ncbi:MAG: B12-binding domain-containing radical SAM protein, partial [Marinilabiliaceae bacterium]
MEFRSMAHPMGLAYLGAVLEKEGHKVKIHDCCIDNKNLDVLLQTLKNWRPDFIGISILLTEFAQTRRIINLIRNVLPRVPIVFGGAWPSTNPKEAIKTFGADFVVVGEGELAFPQLLYAIENGLSTEGIPGIASLVDEDVKVTPGRYLTEDELNALPFPAWDLFDHKIYAKMHSVSSVGCRPYMSIVTSRGCPYRCAYCHQTMGKIFRKRSAESVLAEMEALRFSYGFKEFEILDDCFNLDRERMHAILTGIRDRLGDVKLHFPVGLRSDRLEPEDMALFKQAGTVSAGFAIETSSPRLQKLIQKNLNLEKAAQAIQASVKEGIYSTGFFMLGFPTETYADALGTVNFASHSPLHRAIFMFVTPFEGTKLAEMAEKVLQK